MAEEDDFERQLQLEKEEQSKIEQGYTYTDPSDGTEYEWDAEKQAWFPKVHYEGAVIEAGLWLDLSLLGFIIGWNGRIKPWGYFLFIAP